MLRRGTLWSKTQAATRTALSTGALRPIPTDYEFTKDEGVDFLVRKVANLTRKHKAKENRQRRDRATDVKTNPFLPYEKAMFVADLTPTHVCLLNKFNVIDHHLLIVTRRFENQEKMLTPEDFAALSLCMDEFDGLAFYNGGAMAGASEAHKHLQMIPLPMAGSGPRIPIEVLFASTGFEARPSPVSGLPFDHLLARVDHRDDNRAKIAYDLYRNMLDAMGLNRFGTHGSASQSGPYNLLWTRQWMLLVPRQAEFFQTISVNALGFAGALLVRSDEEVQALKRHGPMAILKHTAMPRR